MPKKERFSLWDIKEKVGQKSFFGIWALDGFPSSLAWTKEEIVLLSGERSRTVLDFWVREKPKRRESLTNFSLPSNILFWSILDIKKVWGDRSRLWELALPWRAISSRGFVWIVRRGWMLVRLWATREDF